jgi:hypothetical protein
MNDTPGKGCAEVNGARARGGCCFVCIGVCFLSILNNKDRLERLPDDFDHIDQICHDPLRSHD